MPAHDGAAAAIAVNGFTASGWRARVDLARPEVRPVIVAAVGDIGIEETPGNHGLPIARYGALDGKPWCAYACCWWWSHSTVAGALPKRGSAYKLHLWAVENGALVPGAEPLQPGDLLLQLDDETFVGHVALYCDHLDDGRICTVEGNARDAVRGIIRRREDFRFAVRPLRNC